MLERLFCLFQCSRNIEWRTSQRRRTSCAQTSGWFLTYNELMRSNRQTTKPLVFPKFFPRFFLSFNAQWVCQLKKKSWIRNIRNTKFVDSEFVVWWFGSISSLLNVWNLVDPFNITEFFLGLGKWEEVDPKATKSKKTTATSSLFLKTFAMSHQIIRFDFSNFSQSFRTIVCWLIFFLLLLPVLLSRKLRNLLKSWQSGIFFQSNFDLIYDSIFWRCKPLF